MRDNLHKLPAAPGTYEGNKFINFLINNYMFSVTMCLALKENNIRIPACLRKDINYSPPICILIPLAQR